MKIFRLIIYILFFAFNISLLILTLYMDSVDNKFEIGVFILPKIAYLKYGALFGVILVIIDFIVDKIEKSILSKKLEETQSELISVKAELYDLLKKENDNDTNPSSDTEDESNKEE